MFDLSKNTGSSLRPPIAIALLVHLAATKADVPVNLADVPCGQGPQRARASRIIGGSTILHARWTIPQAKMPLKANFLGLSGYTKSRPGHQQWIRVRFWIGIFKLSKLITTWYGSLAKIAGPLWRFSHYRKACPNCRPLCDHQAKDDQRFCSELIASGRTKLRRRRIGKSWLGVLLQVDLDKSDRYGILLTREW